MTGRATTIGAAPPKANLQSRAVSIARRSHETSPNCLGQRSLLTSMLPNPRTTVAAFMSAPHLCLHGGICPFPTPHNLVGLSARLDPSSSPEEGILTPKEGIWGNKMSPRKGGLALFSLGLPVLRTTELLT